MTQPNTADPRRHIHVRMVAAQLVLHAVLPPLPPDAGDPSTVFDAAVESVESLGVTHGELLLEFMYLIAKHADTREVMVSTLQEEIADQRLYLENVS
ncbi:hypothetical protein MINTM001_24760 [Mycobacterium paraintracellulare]|uniref:hypothetical protein n=1 Tax=Mycobacterium paraintracellulare TaxID=1138383 RepID=UPI0019257347|nr:hypothetical protein [Mycobacterium paraintracellulare]BCO41337.1 hypothetical protein MINTM001_24760 [Mycobacterium paraintracellulare]